MEILLTAWAWLSGNGLIDFVALASSVIGVAATIAALTPTPKDDSAVAFLRKIIDWVGMNVLNAKNAKEPK
jgi:hypothetical protein